MTDNGQIQAFGERNGLPYYKTNPSIPTSGIVPSRTRTTQIAKGGKAVVVNATGEVLGKASIAFMQSEEVDQTKFVKLYMDGLRQIAGLSKAGIAVCEIVYEQMQEKVNNDHIILSYSLAKEIGISERTYRRGVRDLLEKEVIYASPAEGMFFLNIQYMFNGNRLHFVKSYHLSKSRSATAPSPLGFDELGDTGE
jgi:hypothetical protein